MKKWLKGALLLLVVVSFVLISCEGNSNSGVSSDKATNTTAEQVSSEPASSTKSASDKIKITVVGDGGNNQVAWLWNQQEMEDEFGCEIEIVSVPFENLYTKLKTEFVGNTGAYDIIVYFPKFMGDFVENGYIIPIDDYIAKDDPNLADIVPAFQELYGKWGGKTYNLPYDGDVLALFYRNDIFTDPIEKQNFKAKYGYELHTPKTWDEYMDIAEFFTRKKGDTLMGKVLTEDFYGTATYGQQDFQYCWYMCIAGSMGADYFDEDMNPTINSPEAVKALELFKEQFKYCPPECTNFGFDELQAIFLEGNCAMEIQWTDPGRVGQNPEISNISGKIGTALVPGTKQADGTIKNTATLAAGRVMAISSTCKNPDIAYQIIRYMSQEASLAYVSSPQSGQDPFRFSHYENTGAFEMFERQSDAVDYLNGIKENLEHGYPELMIPGAQQYLDQLAVNINDYISSNTMTAQKALDNTAKQWNDITNTYGKDNMKTAYKNMLVQVRSVGL
ncbi:MAG: sugar ABC transporter substrate-binding protein [Candidatus Cloacimonetes bacterium]|nr:sugar ABC transporter substrate-binding protein [Candidatus Cloacimonadota bacterium]